MAQTALLGLSGLYVGDYLSARYRIPDDRQTLGSAQVKTLYAVRQKSGRIEYSLGDTETEPCVRSLFPHLGYIPCWYLRRHATKRIEIGRVGQSVPMPAQLPGGTIAWSGFVQGALARGATIPFANSGPE